MHNPATYVQPIHFEDFDGAQFERLVFAYHVRLQKWQSLEWYGQVGSDLGRDIWGVAEGGATTCIQCVNRESLTFTKIRDDLSKVLNAANGVPHQFRVVTRASVSASMRDKIKNHVHSSGVRLCEIWSGNEFEEFLRHGAESLLKRFVEGETFPDTAFKLALFAQQRVGPESGEQRILTREAASSILEAYRCTIQGFIGAKLPPLHVNPLGIDRGQGLIDRLLLPQNAFLIGPSGTAKTFHLHHLAISITRGNSELPIFADAKSYAGGHFRSHIARCTAPLFNGELNLLLMAIAICGLRPVLLLDALNECPSRHLDNLLSGAQEFLLHHQARLVGTSQTTPILAGSLRSDLTMLSLPIEEEKERIYAYHAGLPINADVKYLCVPFTNAYDLTIAGVCHSIQPRTPSRADLYDRYVRHSIPDNTAVLTAFLHQIAQELSASLTLVMSRSEMERRAAQFLTDQMVAISVLDDFIRCRLLSVSDDFVSFEHELLFDYFRAESLLRQFREITEICIELVRPRNHGLFELVLSRFSNWADIEMLLLTASSVDSLGRVMQGACGVNPRLVLERQSELLLDAARHDLANVTLKCECVVLEGGKRRVEHIKIEGNREWKENERILSAVIAHNLNRPELKTRFLVLLDETEARLKLESFRVSSTEDLRPERVWAEVVRCHSGTLDWGRMDLPCTTILASIRDLRMTPRLLMGTMPIQEELIDRALSVETGYFALHVLTRDGLGGDDDPRIEVKLLVAERGLNSRIGIIQLDALDLLRRMSREIEKSSESQKQHARELLEQFETNDIIMNSLRLEVLASHGGLELIVTEDEAIAEMRSLIADDEPSPSVLEAAKIAGLSADELSKEWANNCLSKIFEDIFQGVYWNAYQALDVVEKTKLLCLAAMAKRTGFTSDWILSELQGLKGNDIVPVYGHWASGIDHKSFSPQEASMTFMLAIQGWAKSEPFPPSYREPISIDDEAWEITGKILFWHFRQSDVEGRLQLSQDFWRSLSERAPDAAPDVLYQLSHSQWRDREKPFPVRIDLDYPDMARPLLERAISRRTLLTSIFPNGWPPEQGLILYILATLGAIGNQRTVALLEDLVENPRLGKSAIEAIAAIRSRMQRL